MLASLSVGIPVYITELKRSKYEVLKSLNPKLPLINLG
jgi:hypothetical protein